MTLNESSTGRKLKTESGKWKVVVLICVSIAFHFSLLTFHSANAQNRSQLEQDRARVEQEIRNLNSQLAKAKKSSRSNQKQLKLLEQKINQRTRLINNINGQINLLDIQMTQTQDSIALMRSQVDSMKAEYAHVVRVLYGERGNLDKLVLLLDTRSYNYAYLRTRYFRDYSRYRRRQAAFIRQKEEELNDVSLSLQQQQREQTKLLEQQKRQRAELDREQRQRQRSLTDSRQQERDLQARISRKEKEKRQLQQQIQRIINEEIARANNNKKKASSGSSGGGTAASAASSAEVALSADFASNKGRLPWPVTYTKIARGYGAYTHSSGGQNMNNGIDLVCKGGAAVQAVFGGTVSRVFTCPNGTKGIIIRHGEYMTVYANMGTVTVREGAKVTTKQNLGTVYTNDDGTAEFSFQLWKGTSSQNPRTWLR